jgi:alpha-tubulin suppressor-like RCC1 family protein
MATTTTCASGLKCVERPTILMVTRPGGGKGTLTATTIDAGSNHTCIVDTLNDAYCWGDGNNGQVGFAPGQYGEMSEATKVSGGVKFTYISAGTQSTCASGTGGVYCWGLIQQRAAGPTRVTTNNGLIGLSVGDRHACGIAGSTRETGCWGNNTWGQLANDRASVPAATFAATANFGSTITRVTTEQSFTCADFSNGAVQCAGLNTYGTLGSGPIGTSTSTGNPQTVSLSMHGVSTGSVHACALDANNAAFCWGNGNNGQVGQVVAVGASGVFPTPQVVPGGRAYRAIAAGYQHTCAIGTDNHIYCWGHNNYRQLGTQTSSSLVTAPVQALDPVL